MEDPLFDVFRIEDPSLVWIGSTNSMEGARKFNNNQGVRPPRKIHSLWRCHARASLSAS